MEPQGDIALIGLAVMGQNLILNMNDHGFTVVAYNRTHSRRSINSSPTKPRARKSSARIPSRKWSRKLKKPRRVMMLVKAGKPVDEFIEQLLPHLEPGDIIIDGGNSLFEDTDPPREIRREPRDCSTSAPASAAAKKARVTARASCPAVRPPRGRT